jgi:hypothetical protein
MVDKMVRTTGKKSLKKADKKRDYEIGDKREKNHGRMVLFTIYSTACLPKDSHCPPLLPTRPQVPRIRLGLPDVRT